MRVSGIDFSNGLNKVLLINWLRQGQIYPVTQEGIDGDISFFIDCWKNDIRRKRLINLLLIFMIGLFLIFWKNQDVNKIEGLALIIIMFCVLFMILGRKVYHASRWCYSDFLRHHIEFYDLFSPTEYERRIENVAEISKICKLKSGREVFNTDFEDRNARKRICRQQDIMQIFGLH
jgi:hypothetical protein